MQAERPFVQIRELFRNINKENRELLRYVFEKSDSISLWIIGLSIGGISVIANNIADVQKARSSNHLRPLLLLLAISVTSGIIYRILYLYFFVVLTHTQQGIDIAFSNQKAMDAESLLEGNESFKELIETVASNLGDLSYLLIEYNRSDEQNKLLLYQSVVDSYLLSVNFAQKDTENIMDFVADTYSNFTGISKEK